VVVVRRPAPCTPCAYRHCPIDHPCMRAIPPDEVAAAVETARRAPSAAR
jgi:hypothetical protein